MRRFVAGVGAFLLAAVPYLMRLNNLISLVGLPADLKEWAILLGKVVAGYTVLDWLLLPVGLVCLAYALGFWPHRLTRDGRMPVPELPLPIPEEPKEKPAGFIASDLRLQGRAERNPEPDMPLSELLAQARGQIEPPPLWNYTLKEAERRIDLAIADKIVVKNLHVWGRVGDRALSPLHQQTLRNGKFSHRKGVWTAISDAGTYDITDLHFSRAEINKIWPKEPKSDEPILKSALKKPTPDEKRPPLNPAHEGRCKNALIEVGNFLNGDLTTLHEDLTNAGNSEDLRDLKPYIGKFHARAVGAHIAAKKLESTQWTFLTMMGDFDFKPLIEALGELQKKIAVVKSGVDEGHHEPALMISVKHMLKQNIEVGKIGDRLIKAVDKMDAEFFGSE